MEYTVNDIVYVCMFPYSLSFFDAHLPTYTDMDMDMYMYIANISH